MELYEDEVLSDESAISARLRTSCGPIRENISTKGGPFCAKMLDRRERAESQLSDLLSGHSVSHAGPIIASRGHTTQLALF